MDDLISRQAAISIPLMPKGLRKYQTCNLDDAYDEGWGDYQACISQLPPAQKEPYIDSIVSEIEKTISETRKIGKRHEIHVRINGEMICFGLQLALEIIEDKRNERHDI